MGPFTSIAHLLLYKNKRVILVCIIGFGFVSFRDPADFTKAMREMNGKYVGSRPIKMRKSNWKDRNIDIVRQKQKTKQQMGYKW